MQPRQKVWEQPPRGPVGQPAGVSPASTARPERPLVYVLDDDPDVRDALCGLLHAAGLRVTSFPSAEELLKSGMKGEPACLVLDLELPGASGLELQDSLREQGGPPIVFITGHGNIPSSVRAMKGGAIEFLTKPFGEEELLEAIHTAIERDQQARRERAEVAHLQELYARLTGREKEVLPLIGAGLTNKQSAAKLGIAEVTLQVHRGQIMRKMEAGSVPELVRMAGRLGLL